MFKLSKLAAAALLLCVLGACVAGTDASHQAANGGSVAEVLLGFWHGLIAPFTLVGEIIETLAPSVLPWPMQFYESESTGVLYDVGFYVGMFASPSLLFSGMSRRR